MKYAVDSKADMTLSWYQQRQNGFHIPLIDRYGNVKLQRKPLNTVWVAPEFLKLRARKRKPK